VRIGKYVRFEARALRAYLDKKCRKRHLAEQRATSRDLSRVRWVAAATRDLADVSAHVLVLVPRERRSAKWWRSLMGHASVDTTLNVYTQVLDGSPCAAADKVGSELFTIVHSRIQASERSERATRTERAGDAASE
jgi:hypothetical protein